MRTYSPLRYPGGKSQLSEYILSIINSNSLENGTYVEPYAGGAGVALYLLLTEKMSDICINDIDFSIYSFWYSVINHTEELCRLINDTPVDIPTWEMQKVIQKEKEQHPILDVGFSTFYLNRTNRSGIIKGGVIGGRNQNSDYKIDCRFNKTNLIQRIQRIAEYREHIHVTNLDAIEFLCTYKERFKNKTLINLDPPYYKKGQQLYVNFYNHDDHVSLKQYLDSINDCHWIVTYDSAEEIKEIYKDYDNKNLSIRYTAATKRKGSEILIYSPCMSIP